MVMLSARSNDIDIEVSRHDTVPVSNLQSIEVSTGWLIVNVVPVDCRLG